MNTDPIHKKIVFEIMREQGRLYRKLTDEEKQAIKDKYANSNMSHGLRSVRMPPGWEVDYVIFYDKLRQYYHDKGLDENPLYEAILKKIAFISTKLDAAMAVLADDTVEELNVLSLDKMVTLLNAMKALVEQILRYTHPKAKPQKFKDPRLLTDEELNSEVERTLTRGRDNISRGIRATEDMGVSQAKNKSIVN